MWRLAASQYHATVSRTPTTLTTISVRTAADSPVRQQFPTHARLFSGALTATIQQQRHHARASHTQFHVIARSIPLMMQSHTRGIFSSPAHYNGYQSRRGKPGFPAPGGRPLPVVAPPAMPPPPMSLQFPPPGPEPQPSSEVVPSSNSRFSQNPKQPFNWRRVVFPFPTYVGGDLSAGTKMRWLAMELSLIGSSLVLSQLALMLLHFSRPTSIVVDPVEFLIGMSLPSLPLLTLLYSASIVLSAKWNPSLQSPMLIRLEGRSRFTRFIRTWAILGIGTTLAFGLMSITLLLPDTLDPALEDPFLIELLTDSLNSKHAWMTYPVAVIGPFFEEVIFRGIIFARSYRVLGFVPALLISSGLFALAHFTTPAKMPYTGIYGAALAVTYSASHSLVPSVWLHMLNNGANIFSCSRNNPLGSIDFQFFMQYLRVTLTVRADPEGMIVEAIRKVKRAMLEWDVSARQYDFWKKNCAGLENWMESDLKTLQPQYLECVHALFHALDRDGKGYLSAEEFAWLAQLQHQHHTQLRVNCNIMARRMSPLILRYMTQEDREKFPMLTTNMMLALPHELGIEKRGSNFFSVLTPSDAPSSLFFSSQPKFQDFETMSQLESTRSKAFLYIADPLPQNMVRRWYSIHHRVRYLQEFHRKQVAELATVAAQSGDIPIAELNAIPCTGCTLEVFESYIAQQIMFRPQAASEWLTRATLILQGKEQHPTIKLWQMRTAAESVTTAAIHK